MNKTTLFILYILLAGLAFYEYRAANQAGRELSSKNDELSAAMSKCNEQTQQIADLQRKLALANAHADSTPNLPAPAAPSVTESTPKPSAPQPKPTLNLPPLPPDNLVLNGDFSDGISHWNGDGITPEEYASTHPGADTDVITDQGIIIPLKPDSWTKIQQDFTGGMNSNPSIVVIVEFTLDTTFSTDHATDQDIAQQIQFEGWQSHPNLSIGLGNFLIWIGNINSEEPSEVPVSEKNSECHDALGLIPARGTPFTFSHTFSELLPSNKRVIAFAFPPGQGTAVVKYVYIPAKNGL